MRYEIQDMVEEIYKKNIEDFNHNILAQRKILENSLIEAKFEGDIEQIANNAFPFRDFKTDIMKSSQALKYILQQLEKENPKYLDSIEIEIDFVQLIRDSYIDLSATANRANLQKAIYNIANQVESELEGYFDAEISDKMDEIIRGLEKEIKMLDEQREVG